MMSERFKGEQGDTLTVSEWIVHTPWTVRSQS
jgi:hypothetical protein